MMSSTWGGSKRRPRSLNIFQVQVLVSRNEGRDGLTSWFCDEQVID